MFLRLRFKYIRCLAPTLDPLRTILTRSLQTSLITLPSEFADKGDGMFSLIFPASSSISLDDIKASSANSKLRIILYKSKSNRVLFIVIVLNVKSIQELYTFADLPQFPLK